MDAIKILGSLLSNNAMGSKTGGSILENLMGGGQRSRSGAGDILGTLLGGKRRSSGGGGLGALGAILAAAAASKMGSGHRGGGGSGLDIIGDLLGSRGGGSSVLESLLGGGSSSHHSGGGGLGDLLGGLMGGGSAQPSSGGGGLLDSLLGGSGGGGGGLSSILGAASTSGGGSQMLSAFLGGGEPQEVPQDAQDEAELLIEAMCNAAKADGRIDEGERDAILGRLGDLDQEEIDFLQEHLSSPIDLDDFTRRVPDDMDEQVYAFSLMAVKLDTREEAQYFGHLAQNLGLSGETCNGIHEQLGQPEIFA